jgi:hypothetical protein
MSCGDFGLNCISRYKKTGACVIVAVVPVPFLEDRNNYCSFSFLRDYMCQPKSI